MDQEAIPIPLGMIKPEQLSGIIQEFILREGTDYGETEFSFEEKEAQVINYLKSGKANIYFDPETETCSIVLSTNCD